MIKANEVRLGNWVDGGQLGYVRINSIYIDKYHGVGIPLTKEMLLKAGFARNGEWAEFHFNARMGIRFYNFNYAECDIIQDGKFIAFKNSFIKYVHQLQNLYFALSGEELQIDLS